MTPPRTIETRLTRKAGAVFPGAVVYRDAENNFWLSERGIVTNCLGTNYADAFRALLALMSASRAAQKGAV